MMGGPALKGASHSQELECKVPAAKLLGLKEHPAVLQTAVQIFVTAQDPPVQPYLALHGAP